MARGRWRCRSARASTPRARRAAAAPAAPRRRPRRRRRARAARGRAGGRARRRRPADAVAGRERRRAAARRRAARAARRAPRAGSASAIVPDYPEAHVLERPPLAAAALVVLGGALAVVARGCRRGAGAVSVRAGRRLEPQRGVQPESARRRRRSRPRGPSGASTRWTTASPGPTTPHAGAHAVRSPCAPTCARRSSSSGSVTGRILLEFPPVSCRRSLYLLKNNAALYRVSRLSGPRQLEAQARLPRRRLARRAGAARCTPCCSSAAKGIGEGRVVAVDTRTGRTRWSRKLPSRAESSPLLASGRAVLRHRGRDGLRAARQRRRGALAGEGRGRREGRPGARRRPAVLRGLRRQGATRCGARTAASCGSPRAPGARSACGRGASTGRPPSPTGASTSAASTASSTRSRPATGAWPGATRPAATSTPPPPWRRCRGSARRSSSAPSTASSTPSTRARGACAGRATPAGGSRAARPSSATSSSTRTSRARRRRPSARPRASSCGAIRRGAFNPVISDGRRIYLNGYSSLFMLSSRPQARLDQRARVRLGRANARQRAIDRRVGRRKRLEEARAKRSGRTQRRETARREAAQRRRVARRVAARRAAVRRNVRARRQGREVCFTRDGRRVCRVPRPLVCVERSSDGRTCAGRGGAEACAAPAPPGGRASCPRTAHDLRASAACPSPAAPPAC